MYGLYTYTPIYIGFISIHIYIYIMSVVISALKTKQDRE